MTFAEYVAIEAVNWSSLKIIVEESPLAYYHAKYVAVREETRVFRIGRGIHALVLEGEAAFRSQFWKQAKAVGEGSRKANAAMRAQAVAAGVTTLDDDEWEAVLGASASVKTNPWATALLKRGLSEHVVTWTDKETGLPCKARIDFAGPSMIDLKSALRIKRRVFTANAIRLGYPGQFAHYENGLRANGIEPDAAPHMIVVQSEMPHDVMVYRMTPEAMELGQRRVRRCLRILAECLDADYWPGAGASGPVDFEVPRWAHDDDGWSLAGDSDEHDSSDTNEAKEST